MRTSFVEELCELASTDDRVWLLTGDLGYSVLEPFAEEFPGRFINAGVAEQNMTGVAAGLALSGKVVFTYSIANFPTFRCLEQIRNDVCHHNLDVKIVSVGGGLVYGPQGYTHHGVEDLAVMRILPNMTVIVPADPIEARLAIRECVSRPGPFYLRLSRSGDPAIHDRIPRFEVGRAITVRDGGDVTLVSAGTMVGIALEAAEMLSEDGIDSRVLDVHTVQPVDEEALRKAAAETGLLATLEEHSEVGGLHAAVLEATAREPATCLRFALPSRAEGISGSRDHWIAAAGLLPEDIRRGVRGALRS